jgi:predicted Fe-S protein YdhL (DUF1289 family)
MTPIASPCNSVCRIDPRSGLCEGCYRTLDEIARWSAIDEAQKLALRDQLRLRRRAQRLSRGTSEAPP